MVLIESLLISLGGAALGLVMGTVALQWLPKVVPLAMRGVTDVRVDTVVLAFTLLVAIVTALIVGIVPAIEALRIDASYSRPQSRRTVAKSRQRRLGHGLIVFQLATTLMLLTCAGLLARSFGRVISIDLGFEPSDVVVADVELPVERYSGKAAMRFFTALLEQVREVPGLKSVVLADVAPLGGARMSFSTRDSEGRESPAIDVIAVSSGYFATLRTPFLAGRDFGSEVRTETSPVAIMNLALARRMYSSPNDAIGQQILLPSARGAFATVVGVVKNSPQRLLESAAHPALFVSMEQSGTTTRAVLLLRTRQPKTFQQATWKAMRAFDLTLPPPRFTTLGEVVSEAVARPSYC
jgi:hypothetical protein